VFPGESHAERAEQDRERPRGEGDDKKQGDASRPQGCPFFREDEQAHEQKHADIGYRRQS
jgi:hypothetical protein